MGWGGEAGLLFYFIAISGEGPFHPRKEACVLEGATALGAVFPRSRQTYRDFNIIFFNYLKGKLVTDELKHWWQVTSQGREPGRNARRPQRREAGPRRS